MGLLRRPHLDRPNSCRAPAANLDQLADGTHNPWTYGPPAATVHPVDSREGLVYLGDAIRAARKRTGLSQDALAWESGLDRSYVGGVERGQRNVSYLNLLRIAKGSRVGLDEIVAEALRLEAEAQADAARSEGREEA